MRKFIFATLPVILFLGSCQEDFDHHLKRETQEYTQKHCPSHIEEGNRLDSMTYDIPSRNLTLWYTFSGVLDTPVARNAALNNMERLRHQLLLELRGDTKWETCKDENITFTYSYRSSALQKEIFRISFTSSDYQR